MSEPLNFSSELQAKRQESEPLFSDQPRQRLYTLLTHRFETYQRDINQKLSKVIFFGLMGGGLGLGVTLLLLTALYKLTALILPDGLYHTLMYLVSAAVIGFGYITKLVVEEEAVELKHEDGQVKTWSWGRFDNIIDPHASSALCGFLGIILAAQISLIIHHQTHLGLGETISFWQATVLSLDNLLHGVCLDIMEMYDLKLSSLSTQPSTLTTTIFFVFRLGYDALFLMWLYTLYQRHQVRTLFKSYPKGKQAKAEPLLEWMQESCASQHGWVRLFTDELIFLMICEEYLRGNQEVVRHLGGQFTRLRISDEVRTLFVNRDHDEPLFAPQPQEE